MDTDLIDTGRAILRELSPHRRLSRAIAFYVLIFLTIVATINAPKEWMIYLLIFMVGSNLLFLSSFFEEIINKWQNKSSAT